MIGMTSVCLRDTTLFFFPSFFFLFFSLQYCTWMWAVWPFALLLSVSHLNSSRLSVVAVLVRLVLTKLIHALRMCCGSGGKPNVLVPDFSQEVVPHSSMAMIFLCCSPQETPRFAETNVTGRGHCARPRCPCFFFVRVFTSRSLSTFYTTITSDRGIEMLKQLLRWGSKNVLRT